MSPNPMREFWASRDDSHPLASEQLIAIKTAFAVPGEIRPIVKAPGYAISDDGRAFSGILCSWQQGTCPRELKPIPHRSGYRSARLHISKRATLIGIHVLVAEAFLPPPLEGQDRVRHLDDNPANNVVGNLAWGTQSDNMADMIRHGRSLRGEKNPLAKLDQSSADEIRRLASTGMSRRIVGLLFGVSPATVDRIVWGQSWNR